MTQVQAIQALTTQVQQLIGVFSEHAKKLEEVHSKVSAIQYDINGSDNNDGIGERLKNIERWKQDIHLKIQKDETEASTKDKIFDGNWGKFGIAFSALTSLATIIVLIIKK